MNQIYELVPILKEYLWGGTKLKKYKKSDLEKISESWEFSCFENNFSSVVLDEKIVSLNQKHCKTPLKNILIKLIDSAENLSIQVHPDDEYALKFENSLGKTELWVILDCSKDSFIYLGFNDNLKKEEFNELIKDDSILNKLNKVKVNKGDIYLINPGTIHAIGKGITLLEVQEASNITYRVYDFNRIDKNGNKRELHISKANDVINFNKYDPINLKDNKNIKTNYFSLSFYKNTQENIMFFDKDSILVVLDRSGSINNLEVKKYHSYYVEKGTYNLSKNFEFVVIN